jgi:hypothetical protein
MRKGEVRRINKMRACSVSQVFAECGRSAHAHAGVARRVRPVSRTRAAAQVCAKRGEHGSCSLFRGQLSGSVASRKRTCHLTAAAAAAAAAVRQEEETGEQYSNESVQW